MKTGGWSAWNWCVPHYQSSRCDVLGHLGEFSAASCRLLKLLWDTIQIEIRTTMDNNHHHLVIPHLRTNVFLVGKKSGVWQESKTYFAEKHAHITKTWFRSGILIIGAGTIYQVLWSNQLDLRVRISTSSAIGHLGNKRSWGDDWKSGSSWKACKMRVKSATILETIYIQYIIYIFYNNK